MASQAVKDQSAPAGADASAHRTEPAGAERRQHERHNLSVDVDFESASNFFTGLTQDISRGGLFVATHALRKVGERISLSFKLPGEDKPIEVEADVRWVRENTALQRTETYGMGLQFVNLAPEAAAAIDRFMSKRDSIFYDVD